MDTDVTEPIAVVVSPKRAVRRSTVIGGTALLATLALIGGLVWAVSSTSTHKKTATKPAEVSAPAEPSPEPSTDAAGGTPSASSMFSLPGLTGSGAGGGSGASEAGLLNSPAMAAFAPTSGSTGSGSAPTVKLPSMQDGQWPAINWPAGLPGSALSADAASGLVSNIGGWATSSVIALGNNGALLLGDLILYAAYTNNGQNILPQLQAATATLASAAPGATSTLESVAANLPSLPSASQLDLSSVNLPDMPSLDQWKLPSGTLQNLQSLEKLVPSGSLPNLPSPDQLGVPAATLASMPSLDQFNLSSLQGLKLPSLEQMKLPGAGLPDIGSLPKVSIPQVGIPGIGAPGLPKLNFGLPDLGKGVALPALALPTLKLGIPNLSGGLPLPRLPKGPHLNIIPFVPGI